MKKYTFHLIHSDNLDFEEKDHVIFAHTLPEAIHKFERKHEIEAPAYWDEPSYETTMEIYFKDAIGLVRYRISW